MTTKKKKVVGFSLKLIFYIYIIVIFYFVLVSERYGRDTRYATSHANLVLFKEIHRFWEYRSVLSAEAFITNLIGNIFAFSPFGFLFPKITKKKKGIIKVLCATFIFSLCIESSQYIMKVGVFDVDDLLMNTIGGLIGYLIYKITELYKKKRSKKHGKA